MFWSKQPQDNLELKFIPADAIMQKHFSSEDIGKIKSMEDMYIGIKNSIHTGIENTKNFVLALADTCPSENCPVKNALCNCEKCIEKHCDKHKEIQTWQS